METNVGFWRLTELLLEKMELALPPVALTFADRQPEGVAMVEKESPSFCSFWRWGERAVFYADGKQHMGCLVGGMVAGFPLSQEELGEVEAQLGEMCLAENSAPDEIVQVPRVGKPSSGVVYGPLYEFPLQPDLVLMWATPLQAVVVQDAIGAIMWRDNPQGAFFARPACSVLSISLAHEKPALSLGCVGMRAYTEIPEEVCLLAVPGSSLGRLEERLPKSQGFRERAEEMARRLAATKESGR